MKYLKVGVERSQWTDVYLEVPDGTDHYTFPPAHVVRAAVVATVREEDWEWDKDGFSIGPASVGPVSEEIARQFKAYKVKEEKDA